MVEYNLEDIEWKKARGKSWKEIGDTYGMKPESIRRAYYRLKDKKEKKASMRDILPLKIPEKTEKVVTVISKPRKPSQKQYQLVTKGDLVNLIADALQKKFELDSDLLKRLQKGYPKAPFGGSRTTRDGGWNSITYAIFEVILKSEKVYIKK